MNEAVDVQLRKAALVIVCEQFDQAIAATKCHGCGCMLHTVEALEQAAPQAVELISVLDRAHRVMVQKKYDCLGCEICFPAVAANAFAEAFPDAMHEVALCPTEMPAERAGWPPLPGEYSILRYVASVAVCTLNSESLANELAGAAPEGLAIVGTLHTENLGIERIIRNVLANPNIRFLLLCGQDTRQLIGHLPGQSMESLFANGIDEKHRIVGATGKRPLLKNITLEHVAAFKNQVQLVSMIGEQELSRITQSIIDCHNQGLPPLSAMGVTDAVIATVRAREPQFYKSDPTGFLVVYPDRRKKELVVEHYTNAGVLDCVVEGSRPTAIYAEIVKRGLVSQLDHAAYLGRELATAERCLQTGDTYIQDRAPGEPTPAQEPRNVDTCGPTCTTC